MSENRLAAKLTKVDKAAILLLSLGETDAAQVLRHMGPKEVQRVGVAMASMRNVHREQVEQVMGEFVEVVGDQTSLGVGADGYIRKMLTQALGEDKANNLIDRILLGRQHQRPGQPEVDGAACRGRRDPLRTPADPGHRGRLPRSRPGRRGAQPFRPQGAPGYRPARLLAEHRAALGAEGTQPDPGEAVRRQFQRHPHHHGRGQARGGHHELPRQLHRRPN
ncbi:flagellar motor switch protein G [Pseudomonas aeruginosa]|nr:flagellar motor switch protein G [Pseudomonas aeruginosa]